MCYYDMYSIYYGYNSTILILNFYFSESFIPLKNSLIPFKKVIGVFLFQLIANSNFVFKSIYI